MITRLKEKPILKRGFWRLLPLLPAHPELVQPRLQLLAVQRTYVWGGSPPAPSSPSCPAAVGRAVAVTGTCEQGFGGDNHIPTLDQGSGAVTPAPGKHCRRAAPSFGVLWKMQVDEAGSRERQRSEAARAGADLLSPLLPARCSPCARTGQAGWLAGGGRS